MTQDNFTFLNKYFRAGDDVALKRGDRSGAQVAAADGLQQFLQSEGLYKGKIDGIFGKGTEKAVKAFQEQHGLEPTGVVTEETFGKIHEIQQEKYRIVEHEVRQKKLANIEPLPYSGPESMVEERLDSVRLGIVQMVADEVHAQQRAKPVESLADFFNSIGMATGVSEFHILPDMEKELRDTNRITVNGQTVSFTEKELRDPEALKLQMEKLAEVISGGEEASHQFGQSAKTLAISVDLMADKARGK